jgi:hypothetical protein
VGASVEGELHLVMDVIVSHPIQCLLLFVLLLFLSKRIAGGHYPGVVTKWMTVSYRYMPMDLIGRLMMRPPIHQLDLEFCFILRVPFSC